MNVMPIQVSCPSCRRPLRVPDDLLGTTVKCPGCEEIFQAAVAEQPVGPAPEPGDGLAVFERRDLFREELPAPPRRTRSRRDRDDDDDEFDDPPPRRFRRDLPPHRGTLILVLGVISLFLAWNTCLGFIPGIPAYILGTADIKKMRMGLMDPRGESQTNTGRWIGLIASIINLVGCFIGALWFAFVIAKAK